MFRLPKGKILKITVIVLFVAFMPLVMLGFAIGQKNKKLILEGAIYVAIFLAAFSTPEDSALYALASLIGVGVIAVTGVRLYTLRDLWLNQRVGEPLRDVMNQAGGPSSAHSPSTVEASVAPSTDLSQALTRATSIARQNENRLPADAYVSILETCRTLDSVIQVETQQPSGDPEFEYELSAMVREYLPAVLRSYLAIPHSMVTSRQTNGRTPNEELVEQLQLLSDQAQTLHSSRHRHASAELSAMGNFLRERFGQHQGGGFDFGIK